jgi:hypothetical protein
MALLVTSIYLLVRSRVVCLQSLASRDHFYKAHFVNFSPFSITGPVSNSHALMARFLADGWHRRTAPKPTHLLRTAELTMHRLYW